MTQWNDWERERYYREENQARQQRVYDQAAQNRLAFIQSESGQKIYGAMGVAILIAIPFYALHAAVDRYSWAGLLFALIILALAIYYVRSFLRTGPGRVVSHYLTVAFTWGFYALAAVAVIAVVLMVWKATDS